MIKNQKSNNYSLVRKIVVFLNDPNVGMISLIAFIIISFFYIFIHTYHETSLIVPGKKLEKTLKEISNEALLSHGRKEEVVWVYNFTCKDKSQFLGERFHCTADVLFSDGKTSQICILRDFYHRPYSKSLHSYYVTMTVSMCKLDSDIVINREFSFNTMFYDYHSELESHK
jgi:hypothetical protein